MDWIVTSFEDYRRENPLETRWTIVGLVAGFFFGVMVGGVGIAVGGGAFGLWGFLVGAAICGTIGNRFGISRDRRAFKAMNGVS